MNFADIKPFLAENHRAVVQTIQPNGAVQSSVVVCGALADQLVLASVYPKSRKVRNLRRNPQTPAVLRLAGRGRFATPGFPPC